MILSAEFDSKQNHEIGPSPEVSHGAEITTWDKHRSHIILYLVHAAKWDLRHCIERYAYHWFALTPCVCLLAR